MFLMESPRDSLVRSITIDRPMKGARYDRGYLLPAAVIRLAAE